MLLFESRALGMLSTGATMDPQPQILCQHLNQEAQRQLPFEEILSMKQRISGLPSVPSLVVRVLRRQMYPRNPGPYTCFLPSVCGSKTEQMFRSCPSGPSPHRKPSPLTEGRFYESSTSQQPQPSPQPASRLGPPDHRLAFVLFGRWQ